MFHKFLANKIVLIILLAFLLRSTLLVIAVQFPERAFMPDSASYIQFARYLLNQDSVVPGAMRTPVYPLFIAMVYMLIGQTNSAIVFVQIIIGVLTVLLTYILGTRFFSTQTAISGAFLAAISIELISSSFYVLSEALFAFLLLGSLLCFVIYMQRGILSFLIVSALIMGVSILCRPIGMYYPILMVGSILVFLPQSLIVRLKQSGIFISVVILVVFPWVVRNYRVIGLPTVSTISSNYLLYYSAVSLEADLRNVSETDVRSEIDGRVEEALIASDLDDTEANRSRVQVILAKEIIMRNPARYVFVHLKSDLNSLLPAITDLTEIFGLTVGGKGTLSVLNRYGLVAAVNHYFEGQLWLLWLFAPLIILLILLYLGNLVSLFVLAKRRDWQALALLVLPIVYLLLIPGAPSLPRFRVPVMPLISLLGGAGILEIWAYLRQRIHRGNFKYGEKNQ